MAEAAASKPGPPPLDPDSVWTKIQQAGVTVPADVIDKLAELDLELSEGDDFPITVGVGCCLLGADFKSFRFCIFEPSVALIQR